MDSSDSKARFSSRVEHYVKYRPTYPPQVADVLRERIGLTARWAIADIGSGTGISAELFLRNGNRVYGVEPNAAMRAAAERHLKEWTGFVSVDGSAEATSLPDASVQLIVAAQAFHWFDQEHTRREFARILAPGGSVVLMWNDRKLGGTPFLEAYEKLLIDFGTDYLKIRHNNITDEQIERFFGGPIGKDSLANEQVLDLDGLRGRLLSSSYVPGPQHPRHPAMLEALREIFDRHNRGGRVTMEYETVVYHGGLSETEKGANEMSSR